MKFQELLKKLGACSDAREWAGEKTIEQIVQDCHRGDWLVWLARRVNVDDRKLTLAKGHCANTVRHLMRDERSIAAVDAAIAYGNGAITRDELNIAASAAYAAAYAADAADAADAAASAAADAAYAAYAAASAAASAAYAAADAAASAAAYAAYAAADAAYTDAAYTAAYAAARAKNSLQTADICRQHTGQEIIERVNLMLSE